MKETGDDLFEKKCLRIIIEYYDGLDSWEIVKNVCLIRRKRTNI